MSMFGAAFRYFSFVGLLLVALAGDAFAGPCPVVAVVEGETELVHELSIDLLIGGIERERAPGCPFIRVRAERNERGSISVVMVDQYGRSAQRSVGATSTAVAVIASWAKEASIQETTWEVPSRISAEERPPGTQQVSGQPVDGEERIRSTRSGISVLFELALDTHDQGWVGAAVSGCVELGSLCIGGLARYSSAEKRFGDLPVTLSPFLNGGYALDAVATISSPVDVGQFVLSPELHAGFGFVEHNWSPSDPSLRPIESSMMGPRLGARLGATRKLGRGYSLDLGISLEALPTEYMRYDVTLPPEKSFSYNSLIRVGIGLRHGGE